MSAREEILGRIRTALGPERSVFEVPSLESLDVSGHGSNRESLDELSAVRGGAGLVERFAERVADYRATVVVTDAAGVAEAVADACDRHRIIRLGVPDGFDETLVPGAVVSVPVGPGDRDNALAFAHLDALIAEAPLGIAETGTIVFDAGPGQGPRAASLLPDRLICVIDESALVDGVGPAMARMRAAVDDGGRPLTMVSGPSATSDIELDRVEGVHGPRILEVVVRTSAS